MNSVFFFAILDIIFIFWFFIFFREGLNGIVKKHCRILRSQSTLHTKEAKGKKAIFFGGIYLTVSAVLFVTIAFTTSFLLHIMV